jgi:hypothetical protein
MIADLVFVWLFVWLYFLRFDDTDEKEAERKKKIDAICGNTKKD